MGALPPGFGHARKTQLSEDGARYLTELSVSLAQTPLDGLFEGYDSTEAELCFMCEALGPLASTLGVKLSS